MEQSPIKPATPSKSRGKYITLAILLAWVLGVFIFTLLKFGGSR